MTNNELIMNILIQIEPLLFLIASYISLNALQTTYCANYTIL